MRNFLLKRKVLYPTFAVMLLTWSLPKTMFSQASTTITNDFIPVVEEVFVPCANGGAGELVQISGTRHIRTHLILNQNQVIRKVHSQLLEPTGRGLITDDVYHVVNVIETCQNFAINSDRFAFTADVTFMLIGPGPNNNFTVHQNFHTQVNPNGEVTSDVENIRVSCK